MLVPLIFLLPTGLFALQHPPSPLVAFSSRLDVPPSQNTERNLISSPLDLIADYDWCSHDAIAVVLQPGLGANDLYSLPSSSPLSQQFSKAPLKTFKSHSSPDFSPSDLVASLERGCAAESVRLELGGGAHHSIPNNSGTKLIVIELPEVVEEGRSRKDTVASLMSTLSGDLRSLSSVFRSYAVIISGSVATRPAKRDVAAVDVRSPFFLPRVSPSTFTHNRLVADNSTVPAGGILKRYQLLTPGLLLTLIITLLLLFPIVFIGISALANIKSPQRMDAPKVDRRGQ